MIVLSKTQVRCKRDPGNLGGQSPWSSFSGLKLAVAVQGVVHKVCQVQPQQGLFGLLRF
jgi:hypothetical protein